ncbi:universal stress protein [Flavihumibacter profundi]|jgi:nucleotide-binding universal stress UspA family protein|uniref:universal stress protein n=1 Tax=Flavihumibacter profundi TaxID=2716883 RepID=UPI001CC4127F|nr:universal stress protein [Flavihumibacter profundi]MBZ5856376.1 universal stress protein [Flavihumibacter profundi]
MKVILVPIDFSETSRNAARFALAMASGIIDSRLIFYHVFSKVPAGSDGTPVQNDRESRKKIVETALQNFVTELSPSDSVEIVAEEGVSLTDTLVRYVRHHEADLVVMGLTGATRLEQLLMGSNALNMALEAVCPVLIVPPDAQYTGIKNILFATTLKEVSTHTPIKQLKQLLSFFRANLHIVNVDVDHYVELTDEYKKERAEMQSLLADFSPEFYFIRIMDFVDAINTFAADFKIDLIITVPRKHSFLSSLFNQSSTKKLLYHTHVPLVAIRE